MSAAFTQVSDIQAPTDYIQKIYEDALFVAREQELMSSLVTNYTGQGIAPRISSEYCSKHRCRQRRRRPHQPVVQADRAVDAHPL